MSSNRQLSETACDTVKETQAQTITLTTGEVTLVQTPIQTLSEAQEWDLSDLYQSFDDPKFEADLQELDRRAQAFRGQYRGQLAHCSPSQLAIALQDLEAIHQKSGYLYAFPSLKFSADTRDS